MRFCRAAGEVCSGVVAKCLNQRAKTKDLGVAILMAFIEAEKQEIVQVCTLLPVDTTQVLFVILTKRSGRNTWATIAFLYCGLLSFNLTAGDCDLHFCVILSV